MRKCSKKKRSKRRPRYSRRQSTHFGRSKKKSKKNDNRLLYGLMGLGGLGALYTAYKFSSRGNGDDEEKHVKRNILKKRKSKVKRHASSMEDINNWCEKNGYVYRPILGDGNCMFRAFAYGYVAEFEDRYVNDKNTADVREGAIDMMKYYVKKGKGPVLEALYMHTGENMEETGEEIVRETIDERIKRMTKNGEWGERLELQMLSNAYDVCIRVINFDAKPGNYEDYIETICPDPDLTNNFDESTFDKNDITLGLRGNHYFLLERV